MIKYDWFSSGSEARAAGPVEDPQCVHMSAQRVHQTTV